MKKRKTYIPKEKDIKSKWYIVDADGKVLGRLASRVADVLRGKDKVVYTPHMDVGDGVIVINARKVKVTGRKEEQKVYQRYSGYPGGRKVETLSRLRERDPKRIITLAVRGMVPHNRLGRKVMRKLKVYEGAEYPHTAQKPEPLDI
jgi:large subunit ribosomal protein L13